MIVINAASFEEFVMSLHDAHVSGIVGTVFYAVHPHKAVVGINKALYNYRHVFLFAGDAYAIWADFKTENPTEPDCEQEMTDEQLRPVTSLYQVRRVSKIAKSDVGYSVSLQV